jgi:hypothetical protein
MPPAQTPKYSALNVKARIDTHLAVQIIAQHEPYLRNGKTSARLDAYCGVRARTGQLVDVRI